MQRRRLAALTQRRVGHVVALHVLIPGSVARLPTTRAQPVLMGRQREGEGPVLRRPLPRVATPADRRVRDTVRPRRAQLQDCLLYTSDAADDLLCVDLGGRRIIKKK